MHKIGIHEIEGIRIGHAQNFDGGTGCTVILGDKGMRAAIDVRGGGPASRETDLLKPSASVEEINALLLSGGSAFGLSAATGVMEYLEEQNIGYKTSVLNIPIVCASCLFDLAVATSLVRPNAKMAYEACVNADKKNAFKSGCIGAGTGATVGKLFGSAFAMKSGIGSYAVQIGEIKIGAIMAVNAIGDIYENGEIIAGLYDSNKKIFLNTERIMMENCTKKRNILNENTTIGVVITNAFFNKTELSKVSSTAQNGMARAIYPVHTSGDGDTIYALSVGDKVADLDAISSLSSFVTQKAIIGAIKSTTPMYGFKSFSCIQK